MEASDHIPTGSTPSPKLTGTACPSSDEYLTAAAQAQSPDNTHPAIEWIAPYHSYSGNSQPSQYGGTYTVYFFANYNLAAHQEFLGFKVEGTHRRASYEADLNSERLEIIRTDPGVEKILEGCPMHWLGAADKDGNETARAMLESDREEASTVDPLGNANITTPKNIVGKEIVAAQIQSPVQKPMPGQEWIAPYCPYDGSEGPCRRYDRYVVEFFEGHTMAKHREFVGVDIGGLEGSQHWYQRVLSEEQRERVRRDPGVAIVQQCGPAVWG